MLLLPPIKNAYLLLLRFLQLLIENRLDSPGTGERMAESIGHCQKSIAGFRR